MSDDEGLAQLVPPGLAELLGLMSELAELLPAATTSAGWNQRHDVQGDRQAVLRSRLQLLHDELEFCKKYPTRAREDLASYCQRAAEAIRAELAKPLGYEPKQVVSE